MLKKTLKYASFCFVVMTLLFCLNIRDTFSQKIETSETKYFLKFKVLETKKGIKNYIFSDNDSLNFVEYDNKSLPKKLKDEDRVIILRSTFYIDSTLQDTDLALVVPPISYACNIYLNGAMLSKLGNVKDGYTSRIHFTSSFLIPSEKIFFGTSKKNEIIIELQPRYGENSPVTGIFISTHKSAESYAFWRNLFSIHFMRSMIVATFIIFFYYLIFYFANKKFRPSYYIPFAIACLLYTTSYLNNVFNYNFANEIVLEKITRTSQYLWCFFTLYYVLEYTQIFKKYKNKIILFSAVGYLFFIIINLLPSNSYEVIIFYLKYGSIYSLIISTIYLIICIKFFVKEKSYKSGYILSTCIIVAFAIIHDTYYFNILFQKPYLLFLPYGMFLTVIMFFFILSWEQNEIYRFATQKTEELERLNKNLEDIVKERTKKIAETEKHFRFLVENIYDVIWILDLNIQKFVYVSPSVYNLRGYTAEEVINQDMKDSLTPESYNKVQNIMQQSMPVFLSNPENPNLGINEVEQPCKDGSTVWTEAHTHYCINPNNQHIEVLGVSRNITKRKQTEQQYRLLFQHMTNAFLLGEVITEVDKESEDFKIVLINNVFADFIGKPAEELIDKKFTEVKDVVNKDMIRTYCNVGISGTPINIEYFSETFKKYFKAHAYSPEKNFVAIILEDITEKKYTELELQESEIRFRAIFEQAAVGFALLETHTGRFVRINKRYCDFLGYTEEEMLEKTFYDVTYHKDQQPNAEASLSFISRTLEEFSYEKKYIHKNGLIIWGKLTTSPLWQKNEIPKNYYHIAIVEDITLRKQQEEQLFTERIQLLTLLNSIPEPIYVSDYETAEILFANDAKKQLFGENIKGNLCYKAFHNTDSPCEACHKKKFTENNNELIRWEVHNKFVNKYFYNMDRLITWHDGRKAKFQISFDLTDLKIAEYRINKLSVAVEQNPATIVITDVCGNIEYANQHFTKLTGYTIDEAKGQNQRILKSGKTDEALFKELWQTITAGKTWKGEFINKKKNGEEFTESALIAPIFDSEGKIINYVAIKEDITARKQQERDIQNYLLQLEELNATKDKFFGIIAHDLKNPFNSILGFTDLLVNNFERYENKKIFQFVKTIQNAGIGAYKLLENLLEWSRTQTGRMEFKPSSHILENIVLEVITFAESMATAKDITVNYEIDSAINIIADINMLHTILRNLVSNAIKFTNKKGKVKIMAQQTDNKITITVKDNGIGMTTDKIDRLFKITEKVSTLGTEKETGTGLGLLLCKEFIEKHNGKIWVNSQPNMGTEFCFYIPQSNE